MADEGWLVPVCLFGREVQGGAVCMDLCACLCASVCAYASDEGARRARPVESEATRCCKGGWGGRGPWIDGLHTTLPPHHLQQPHSPNTCRSSGTEGGGCKTYFSACTDAPAWKPAWAGGLRPSSGASLFRSGPGSRAQGVCAAPPAGRSPAYPGGPLGVPAHIACTCPAAPLPFLFVRSVRQCGLRRSGG